MVERNKGDRVKAEQLEAAGKEPSEAGAAGLLSYRNASGEGACVSLLGDVLPREG